MEDPSAVRVRVLQNELISKSCLSPFYYKSSLFNAHTMILIVDTFMTVNKLCLNQTEICLYNYLR